MRGESAYLITKNLENIAHIETAKRSITTCHGLRSMQRAS